MAASITRSVAVSVILIEMTGHFAFGLPIMVGTLVSYFTTEYINQPSIFEMFSRVIGLERQKQEKGEMRVDDVLKMR